MVCLLLMIGLSVSICKRYSDAYYTKYVYLPTGAALNEVEKV